MRCLGRLFGCLLVFVIIAITPVAFWLFTMWGVMSNADSYTESLDDEAYEELAVLTLPLVAELVADTEDGDDSNQVELFSDVITNIDHDEWKAIVGESINAEWVKDLINRNLNNGLDYFRFERDDLEVTVDFAPVFAAISDNEGDDLVTNIMAAVRSWDACNQDDILKMTTYLNGQSNTFPNCNPGEENLNRIENQLRVGAVVIEQKLQEYPNLEFNLRDEVKVDRSQFEDVDEMFSAVRQGFFFIEHTRVVMLLFPIMLFGLVVVFAVRSAKEFFLWGGITLILTGLMTLLPLIPWIYGLIDGANDAPHFFINGSEYELSFRLQRWLLGAFAEPVIAEVMGMLGMGFIFLVVAGFLKGPSKVSEQPVYYVMPGGSTPQPMYPAGQYVQTSTPPPSPTPIPVKKEPPLPTAEVTPPPTTATSSGTPSPSPTVATSETPSSPSTLPPVADVPPTAPESFASEHIRGAVGRLGVDDDMTFVPISDDVKTTTQAEEDGDDVEVETDKDEADDGDKET